MGNLGRILIADDEISFAEVTADLLRDEGYDCDCAPDAQAAKQRLHQSQYDLLVADIKMPGNNSLEFIEELAATADGLPVILLTGYPSLDTAIKATRLSVVGYLQKPMPIEDFLKLVHESVMRSQTLRSFSLARKRQEELQAQLETLVSSKNFLPAKNPIVDVDMFLHFTIKNILDSMMDLKELTQALSQNKPKQNVCHLLNCLRHAELVEVIRDTIFVLEKTKTSFKSKELAALRVKLENTISANVMSNQREDVKSGPPLKRLTPTGSRL